MSRKPTVGMTFLFLSLSVSLSWANHMVNAELRLWNCFSVFSVSEKAFLQLFSKNILLTIEFGYTELIILPSGLNQLYWDVVKPSPTSNTQFIRQIFPMYHCSDAKTQEQNNFFSPLILILKKGLYPASKIKSKCVQVKIMLPSKIEYQECFPSSKATQIGQSVYNP